MSSAKSNPRRSRQSNRTTLLLVLFTFGFILLAGAAYVWKKHPRLLKYLVTFNKVDPYNHKDNTVKHYSVHGIDISHHQGKIKWDELARTTFNGHPIRFVFMKSTEGVTHVDRHFKDNWEQSGRIGVLRGAYHYYKPNANPIEQANHFIRNTPVFRGDLAPVLDLEENGRLSDQQLISNIREWLRVVENHYDIKPIIYVNTHYYKRFIKGNFPDHTVWIAHYHTDRPKTADEDWHFWQHTERGKAAGIKGHVDLNVFRGTAEDLHQLVIP